MTVIETFDWDQCCADCEHQVYDITASGVMPEAADGREVRVLIARTVGRCAACGDRPKRSSEGRK